MLRQVLKLKVKTIVLYLFIRQQSAEHSEIGLLRFIVRPVAIRILSVHVWYVFCFCFFFSFYVFLFILFLFFF